MKLIETTKRVGQIRENKMVSHYNLLLMAKEALISKTRGLLLLARELVVTTRLRLQEHHNMEDLREEVQALTLVLPSKSCALVLQLEVLEALLACKSSSKSWMTITQKLLI
jgi:hypothetical protein